LNPEPLNPGTITFFLPVLKKALDLKLITHYLKRFKISEKNYSIIPYGSSRKCP
jgi:hypothetical protein